MDIPPAQACMVTLSTLLLDNKRSMVTYYLLSFSLLLGMYEGDPYGDEIEGGDEDKNDGLNALVNLRVITVNLEPSICNRV
jgi:hypothetical protein